MITDAALAAYIAKYATKGTGAIEGTDRPIYDGEHIDHLPDLTPHHRQMIRTAWALGGTARRWAHMLGFPGHFLTKSRHYSTTFTAMRAVRRLWRLRHDLDQLAAATHGPDGTPDAVDVAPDLDTITVVNDWVPIRFGDRDDTERELAAAIAERDREQRRTRMTARSTSVRGAA